MSNSGKAVTLFQLIPAKEFQALCDRFNIDKGVRRLTAEKQVWALVMAFILKLQTLREIEHTLGIPRSTLSDANATRDAEFFEELVKLILWKIYSRLKARKIKQAVRTLLALDSTECRIHGSLSKLKNWKAKTASKVTGAKASTKLHIVWNVDGEWIEQFCVTAGRTHDQTAAKTLKIKPNCTYVFDKAYNELGFWYSIVVKNAHFVSRLKKCSYSKWRHALILEQTQGRDGVLWEQDWRPSYPVLRKLPHIPKDFRLRHIIYRDPETKKVFDFITSDFGSPAIEIAAIYKKRWAVELLFRWMKGHLKVRTLEPRNTNAIKVQLTVAVLVQLLVALYRILKKFKGTLWECLRLIQTQWTRSALEHAMRKSSLFELFAPQTAPEPSLSLCYL